MAGVAGEIVRYYLPLCSPNSQKWQLRFDFTSDPRGCAQWGADETSRLSGPAGDCRGRVAAAASALPRGLGDGSAESEMSRAVAQPIGQKRLTNIAIVKRARRKRGRAPTPETVVAVAEVTIISGPARA